MPRGGWESGAVTGHGRSSVPSLNAESTLYAVGLFNGNVRELKEMLYEYEEPFVVDDGRFVAAFGNIATPLPEAIDTTVSWYRADPK